MPSQLIKNEAISFIVAKPLKWRDDRYDVGDDFPQEEAKNIETLIRSRYLIPVVDDLNDKPRHWHREVQQRDAVLERLAGDTVQIVLPTAESEQGVAARAPDVLDTPPDATETEDIEPETPAEVEAEVAGEAVHTQIYDPSYHTVSEVNEYLAAHPDEREAVIEAEAANRNRKGIVEGY